RLKINEIPAACLAGGCRDGYFSPMSDPRPRRSVLYVPGSNTRAQVKARTLPVDALVFDLEDSVADDVKPQAREQVIAEILKGGFGHREVVMRVNAARTEYFEEDMAAAVKA